MDDAADLRRDLTVALAASRSGLDIDLAAVTFCDSSGLHVLLDLDRLALQTGKTLVRTALASARDCWAAACRRPSSRPG
ncbi:STAS domain-containing protein [Streptomyces sp. NPDC059851]|uniref:STAS domain-containing protein n=1 Tax=Streptomyces sp. NPDC059851 TaxID=3346971 RepID=UPI00365EE58E